MNSPRRTALNSVIGLLAGVVATGPMTIAMILGHRRLPMSERYPLPPREITMKLARETGVSRYMNSDTRSAVTLLSHFAYGGAAGAIYGAANEAVDARTLNKGIVAGLLLWVVSYLGWLPGVGVLKAAKDHPARRNALLIGAHLIWGTAMAGFASLLQEEANGPSSKPLSSSHAPHFDLATR